MAWTSILPENLGFVETFFSRLFLIFALITIGPWACLVLYDFCLYLWRSACYVIPFFGGRAQGQRRPRAPSLTERPNGNPRRFTLSSCNGLAKSSARTVPATIQEESPDRLRMRDEKLAPLVAVETN